jgi:hypothetical protein
MNLKVKLFITLPAFLLLAACAGDDAAVAPISDNPGADAKGSAICFNVDDFYNGTADKSATRAAGREDLSRLRNDGFGVFACNTGLHPYVSSTISWNFMWNQPVSYTSSGWSYNPVKHWPTGKGGEELDEYVTFFAYAPFSKADGSDKASRCIVDLSNATEVGDPWLTYQLGGSTDDWQSHQVDLLYAFCKDMKRPERTGERVKFSFRHALAGAGDQVKVSCQDLLQNRLVQLAANRGVTVKLTLDRVVLDYTLTRKGRLVLNNASEPNWQVIASEDPMVHRILELTPAQVLATATSSACTSTTYVNSDLGIFYIPMSPDGQAQQVDVTLYYSLSTGYSGSISSELSLNTEMASQNQNFELILSKNLPLYLNDVPLSEATQGMFVGANGKAYASKDDATTAGTTAQAWIAYKSTTAGESLAFALTNDGASGTSWNAFDANPGWNTPPIRDAIDGGTWRWPSKTDFDNMLAGFQTLPETGNSITSDDNPLYWASTEFETTDAWNLLFKGSHSNVDFSNKNDDYSDYYVRAVFAF